MPGEMGFSAGTDRLIDENIALRNRVNEMEQRNMNEALAFVKRISNLRAAMNRAIILLNNGTAGTDLLALGLLAETLKKDELENK